MKMTMLKMKGKLLGESAGGLLSLSAHRVLMEVLHDNN